MEYHVEVCERRRRRRLADGRRVNLLLRAKRTRIGRHAPLFSDENIAAARDRLLNGDSALREVNQVIIGERRRGLIEKMGCQE